MSFAFGPIEAAPTRLLMTADAVGGVWTYALELAEGLVARGWRVTLAVLGPSLSPDQREEAGRIAGLDLVETGLPLDWTAKSPEAVRRAGAELAALARSVGADLVHLNSPALAAGVEFDVPVVGTCHSCLATWWDAVKGGTPPRDFAWRIALLGEGYRACASLVAPTRAFADATALAYGVRPRVVWNGRALPAAPASAPRETLAVSVGRLWDEGKGAATLEAAARLAATPIEAIGPTEGPMGASVALSAARPLGRMDTGLVAERLRRARIFASPALYEPFGLSVLEAAQAGCALVLSDIPSFRELWEGAALFVPPRNPEALATAIDRLASDGALCERLAAVARRRASAYRPDAMADGMAAIYRQALGAKARTEEVFA